MKYFLLITLAFMASSQAALVKISNRSTTDRSIFIDIFDNGFQYWSEIRQYRTAATDTFDCERIKFSATGQEHVLADESEYQAVCDVNGFWYLTIVSTAPDVDLAEGNQFVGGGGGEDSATPKIAASLLGVAAFGVMVAGFGRFYRS